MMSDGLKVLKYVVFVFNLLIFICGIAVLSVGIWALVNEQAFKKILLENVYVLNGVYIIISVGSLLFLIGFLGCCGAMQEDRCMLGSFFTIVLILVIAQLTGAIFLFANRGAVVKAVRKSISTYGNGTPKGRVVQDGWDAVQKLVKCCGEKGYKDWVTNYEWSTRFRNKVVPDSCCVLKKATGKPVNESLCQLGYSKYIHKDGCVKKLSKTMITVAIVAAVVMVVEILAMIFSCCLYQHADGYAEMA